MSCSLGNYIKFVFNKDGDMLEAHVNSVSYSFPINADGWISVEYGDYIEMTGIQQNNIEYSQTKEDNYKLLDSRKGLFIINNGNIYRMDGKRIKNK